MWSYLLLSLSLDVSVYTGFDFCFSDQVYLILGYIASTYEVQKLFNFTQNLGDLALFCFLGRIKLVFFLYFIEYDHFLYNFDVFHFIFYKKGKCTSWIAKTHLWEVEANCNSPIYFFKQFCSVLQAAMAWFSLTLDPLL